MDAVEPDDINGLRGVHCAGLLGCLRFRGDVTFLEVGNSSYRSRVKDPSVAALDI